MRLIEAEQLEDIALGAVVLGTGGGGDPYIGKLLSQRAIERNGPVRLIDVDELDDDALVACSAGMGAPTVMVEKIAAGTEIVEAFKALQDYLGKPIYATMSAEAGGDNSTGPFQVAAALGIPCVDGDLMGRAFPEIQMVTPTLYGISATPMAIADEKGNNSILNTIDNKWTETLSRNMTIEMGCTSKIALFVMTGKQAKEAIVRGTITYIEQIGRALRAAHAEHRNPIETVRDVTNGFIIWRGKIVDLNRRTETGFARGTALIEGLGEFEGRTLLIDFQNEFLIAREGDRALATTPDLITILDSESGHAITTESLRYGFRVAVLGMPCDPRWRTPGGLELAGPRYFGYDVDYVPIEERAEQ
ncbi:MAG: DUF917 domain-containing protein [Thermomicrobiales bacterium]|nr:DUF917 domain-containing protein [Thermomicrobiales bacterium]